MTKQIFKSIYFADKDLFENKGRSVTVSFSKNDADIEDKIRNLTNEEIREIIGITSFQELINNSKNDRRTLSQYIKVQLHNNFDKLGTIKSADVTFQNSKKTPFQRWYPFTEGYSPDFVTTLLDKYCSSAKNVFDPFSGTGTTFFAADAKQLTCYYAEVNPLLVFISETKSRILMLTDQERLNLADKLEREKKDIISKLSNFEEDYRLKSSYPLLFGDSQYYDSKTLSKIIKLRAYIDKISEEDKLLSDTLIIAVLAILLKVSFLKKVGDVRFKTKAELKKEVYSIDEELVNKINEISFDISNLDFRLHKYPQLLLYNSKKIGLLRDLKIDAVITSPPYLNGTNYLRNTKIELWFLRYLQYPHDLRGLRDQIVTSGINDVKAKNGKSQKEINDFKSIILDKTITELNEKAYDKRIPIMVSSYFHEMYCVFYGLKKHLSADAKILIDIGDSIFANVYIKTDEILSEMLSAIGYKLIDKVNLRKRRSRNRNILTQVLLVFETTAALKKPLTMDNKEFLWSKNWHKFKATLPHQKIPYSKKNWGHPNHSLCSYGGKLKPAIAHYLVDMFVPPNGVVFDPFSGVGTIPFEAALNGKKSFGIDISLPAFYVSSAKVTTYNQEKSYAYLNNLKNYVENETLMPKDLEIAKSFGFNKKLADYFEKNTMKEILLARRFCAKYPPRNPNEMVVVASILHVLHGNRPYALSRRSHPITPYAPTGAFEYKNLYEKVKNKLDKAFAEALPDNFCNGRIFWHDSTEVWPQEINNLDAIITSPPFFDSTRFYLANWMRLWFCGWNVEDFKSKPLLYVEERQKQNFEVYDNIYRQARERLKSNGVLVFHLGRSTKCNMAERILSTSKRYFSKFDLFDECVEHCQTHGIRDKGTVTNHQYLILY